MTENLYSPAHKANSDKYRENWERIFSPAIKPVECGVKLTIQNGVIMKSKYVTRNAVG